MGPLRFVLFVLLVAVIVWGHQRLGLSDQASVEALRALVGVHASHGPLVFIAVCVAGILLQLPPIVLVAAGGLLFEGPQAVAYAWVASVIGTTAIFVVARHLARAPIQRALAGRFARLRALDERLERHGFATVLVLRLVLFLAPPLNWALGASRVRLHHFVAGTALGVLPGMCVTVFFAASIAGREPGAGFWTERTVLGALLVLGFLGVAAVASRWLRGREPVAPAA